MTKTVIAYTDYKSPYAFLAKNPTYGLFDDFRAEIDWRPYTLDIPSYLGSAAVDTDGNVLHAERNAHQWRRVKYSYMDCRRRAERLGLVVRGPRHIFDSTVAHVGMLYAQRKRVFKEYHDAVFERFWKRELDIEDTQVVTNVLSEVGADVSGFGAFLAGEGPAELEHIMEDAHDRGVFGVPSFIVDGQLYWGAENLPLVREHLGSG
tara:strand:- start:573 stop:1190 length:618 start_codon:yes stop_codon:yes gene_type:complete